MEAFLAAAGEAGVVLWPELRSESIESDHYFGTTSCDSERHSTGGVTDEWLDTSKLVDFYYGGGFRLSHTAGVSRDLETMAALEKEAFAVVDLGLKERKRSTEVYWKNRRNFEDFLKE